MNLMKNWRLALLGVLLIASLALLGTKGLTYGIDFTGGTELKLELAHGDEQVADTVVEILKERLNSMGLKSTQVVKEADGIHITVKVSTTDTEELANVKNIINQQALFEQFVDGGLCAAGKEIQLDISSQGGAFVSGTKWNVYVKTAGDAPARCGRVMEGKAGHMTDVFLDRPGDAFILFPNEVCNELSQELFSNHPSDTDYTQLSFIEDRADIPVVCYSEAAEDQNTTGPNASIISALNITIEEGSQTMGLNETSARMAELSGEGKTDVILLDEPDALPERLRDAIGYLNLTVIVETKAEDRPFHVNYGSSDRVPDNSDSWIDRVTGLKSTLEIQKGLTYGDPIYQSVFTGGANSEEEAQQRAKNFKIWLTSGNLPSKVEIVLERPNLPELGQQFLTYAGLIALVAIGLVAAIISIRYRELKISMGILMTGFSEIILILGFASLASWELDMAAMAGIIAAIGTGVDDQIVITDETLRGERRKKDERIWDLKQSINRAFFIIMAAAVTTISAMLPLMSIIDLRGFAFTSIVGILIGVLITRPAYGRLVEIIT